MRLNAKLAGFAVAAAALAGIGALAATPATATTTTCTGAANSTGAPQGCGGLQSATTAHGTLDLAVLGTGSGNGSYFNSPVGVSADLQTSSREDFTVFALGGSTTDGPGHLGMYVAMYTPDGKIPGYRDITGTHANTAPAPGDVFQVGSDVYCLSVVPENNGPGHAARWNTVLRNCSGNGVFIAGNPGGIPATVNRVTPSHANGYQVWAPVAGANNNLLLVNETLSHGYKSGNVQYVLDIKGNGGPGTATLAYPENDQLNEQWSINGCTQPVTLLNSSYWNCG